MIITETVAMLVCVTRRPSSFTHSITKVTMENFKPNQKVVCIDDSPMKSGPPSELIINDIYTIESLHPEGGVFLKEVTGRFLPSRFVPLQPLYRSVGISKELAKSFTETLETSEVIKTQKEKAI